MAFEGDNLQSGRIVLIRLPIKAKETEGGGCFRVVQKIFQTYQGTLEQDFNMSANISVRTRVQQHIDKKTRCDMIPM